MKKKVNKQIREIADKLPPVYEQHVSGGLFDTDETGKTDFIPNVYFTQVNHERRLRHAYEKLGMDGVRAYLESIHKLQLDRNEKAFGSKRDGESGVLPDQPSDRETENPAVSENQNAQ